MHPVAATLLGVFGRNGRLLATPGALRPPAGLARSQGSAQATAPAADGLTWVAFAADAPRFSGAGQALLIEGARTNLIPDARTPGSTGWSNTGIAASVAATGPDGAASAFLLTESTATSLHGTYRGSIAVVAGTTYAASFLVAPGTATACQIAFTSGGFGTTHYANFDLTGAGSVTAQGAGAVARGIERTGDFYRIWVAATATATASSGVGVNLFFINGPSAGRAPSFAGTSRTLRLAWAQMEAGAFPTTPILPPAGAPGQASRGDDVLAIPLGALSIGETGAGSYEITATLPRAAPAGSAHQALIEVEADADNRFFLRNEAGGTGIVLGRALGGAVATAMLGTITPGTSFTAQLVLDGNGNASASLNGGASQAVSGGPAIGLATLRIGNGAAGGTPMNGLLHRLLVTHGDDPVRLGVPPGLGFTPPFSIYRDAGGTYRHGFQAAPRVITGKAYYLSPAGNDANDGLSAATPKRSLWRILQDIADYDVIYLAAGEYDATTGWAARNMARSASLIAVGGRAVLSRRSFGASWAADANPGVWIGTPPSALAIGLVTDAAFPDANGQPQRLARAPDLATCAATPGSFYASGTIVHVRTQDGRMPDAHVAVYYAGSNAVLAGNVNAYFKDIDFVGGNSAFASFAAAASRSVVFDTCSFRFASAGDGLNLDCGGDVFLLDCIAEHNELDGLNYNQSSDGLAAPRVVEIGCTARWNGYTTSGFNNGTSLHGASTGISINCLFERNQNRNVHDVFGAKRWMLGCAVRDSRATDATSCNYVVAQVPGQSGEGIASSLWLDGCASSGSANDLVVNAGGTARMRNMTTGGWTVANAGTLGSY